MSDFENAFNQLSKVSLENHTELWGEPKTERAFFEAGQASKQAIIDQLNSVLEERTKEWLQAIECGTYFENVAKPLKEENDRLKAQLNNMERCYIQKKKQVKACAALVGEWREKPMGGWSDYARGGLHSRQDCADDLEEAMRGEHE